MTAECHSLIQYLELLPKSGVLAPEAEDRIVSVGEKLSARYLAALLEDHGIPSEYVDLSEIINFNVPKRLDQDFYHGVSKALAKRIESCGDKVPILTGYFGNLPGGLLKNLGRGYSDLCAALVAVGVGAAELQVWKEVSGVFTADPNKVRTLDRTKQKLRSSHSQGTYSPIALLHRSTRSQRALILRLRSHVSLSHGSNMNP